jgi:flagellar assembly protein FliH
MTARAKFLFDVDFGGGGNGKPVISVADHNARLAQAEQVAYRNGYSAGEEKAAADAKRSISAALQAVAAALEKLDGALTALETRLESEAVDVAVAVAQKLAPELIAREPLSEISALARDCFRHLVGAAHVVVRVNDALLDPAREALQNIVRERGFEGRLVVLAEPGIAPGDCRVEWADGGIVRDRNATDAAIAELVTRYLHARRSGFAPPPRTSFDLIGRVKP